MHSLAYVLAGYVALGACPKLRACGGASDTCEVQQGSMLRPVHFPMLHFLPGDAW